MDMTGGLGPSPNLPGVRLATDDQPSTDSHRRPPLLPFFFFLPCFFFLSTRHHLPLSGIVVDLLRSAEPHRIHPDADGAMTLGPGLARRWAQTDAEAKPALVTKEGRLTALFLPSSASSSSQASTAGTIEVPNAVTRGAVERCPSPLLYLPEGGTVPLTGERGRGEGGEGRREAEPMGS